jgi:hypothetical protein
MKVSYIFLGVSLLISIVVGILVYLYTDFYNFVGFNKALEGVLLFTSISLGFYGACISVIASIFNTKIVKSIMSDPNDKREFVILVSTTLVNGLLTIVITIIYQVFLENGSVEINILKVINAFWSSFVIMFIGMNILFILVSFLIFFNNKEQDEKEFVYIPTLKK